MFSVATPKTKQVAFAFTEYHQNILLALCLQEVIAPDLLLVRNNIQKNMTLLSMVKKVLFFSDIPFSWRDIDTYNREFRDIIAPAIQYHENWIIIAHSQENPLIRQTSALVNAKKFLHFEDGAGAYASWGKHNRIFGMRAYWTSKLISIATSVMILRNGHVRSRPVITGWSLYPECFPDYKIPNELIDHKTFRKAVCLSATNQEYVNLEGNSSVFIQQPYVEMGILSELQYLEIHFGVLKKISKLSNCAFKKLFWKIHPRTNLSDELIRVQEMEKKTGLEIEVIKDRSNIEGIALFNSGKGISYFALGSSSLYVIRALTDNSENVAVIENESLTVLLPIQSQIHEFYRKIGISVL